MTPGSWEATVCLRRETSDAGWSAGVTDANADWLFEVVLDGTGAAYVNFAKDYYEVDVDENVVREILALTPLTEDLVRRLNAEASRAEADEIGYPVA